VAPVNRNVQRGQATRDHLILVATRLFAAHGYEGTAIETVLQESGASRGSLYHHFSSKETLFDAVLEDIEARVGRETLAAAKATGGTDPVEALRAGCVKWVRLASDPVVQRVLLLDAPSVLGWQRWRDMDEQHALGMIRGALQYIAQQGRLQPQLVDMFAHVLFASMNELALVIARAKDPASTSTSAEMAIDELISRLLPLA
jgi:AcrR family transcriptional regulator